MALFLLSALLAAAAIAIATLGWILSQGESLGWAFHATWGGVLASAVLLFAFAVRKSLGDRALVDASARQSAGTLGFEVTAAAGLLLSILGLPMLGAVGDAQSLAELPWLFSVGAVMFGVAMFGWLRRRSERRR